MGVNKKEETIGKMGVNEKEEGRRKDNKRRHPERWVINKKKQETVKIGKNIEKVEAENIKDG